MSETDRRSIIVAAGVSLAAGALAPGAAAQQTAAAEPIWSAEYWAQKGAVKLNLWRKRAGAPKPGEAPRPVLVLVHGSSNSSRSSLGLTVPGRGQDSFMGVVAPRGFAGRATDH